eukprot:g8476.t1
MYRVFSRNFVSRISVQFSRVNSSSTSDATGGGLGWGQTHISDVLKLKSDQGKWLFCSKTDTVFDAIMKMAKANVGSLLVFDPSKIDTEKGRIHSASADAVKGIITERDYLTKVACEGRSSKETLVDEIMTAGSKLLTVTPGHTVVETMEIMADNNIRHLPVVHNEEMLGMVSIRDMVKAMVREHRSEMDNMQRYIQGMY